MPPRGLNLSRRYEMFYGGGYLIHGGIKYFKEGVK